MARKTAPEPVHLKDYRPPDYRITDVDLGFALDDERTEVTARLVVESSHDRKGGVRPLVLDGQALELVGVSLDGGRLGEGAYRVDDEHLIIPEPPERFELGLVTRLDPKANTALSGLYLSNGILCTQCEAEGFRRITYFLDRPDVMARFRVRLEADQRRFPLLLSNGNRLAAGELEGGRHFATWEDPFPKPAYLFALVAGDLAHLEDGFVTRSGRHVILRIHAAADDIGKCRHAMEALKAAMRWDEETYGFEYDLDLYNIVAVADFNMGAMENKGLNVFNTALTLADPETATDADHMSIERVIAHEYFHNWTGNRITLRDWFQLSLKEGLTVFRDQQFMEERFSAAVQRIGQAQLLRDTQFVEDAGPLAHPVRPASYVEINNFYTRTVYDKGAEVIRMLRTLIGPEAYRRGIDIYADRHDGQAITCEDFVAAMAEASGRDLVQFFRWYEQAGTPELRATGVHDAGTASYRLTVRQHCPPTPGQPDKEPFHIPLAMGLLGRDGAELPLQLEGENEAKGTSRVLELREPEQSFTFTGIAQPPVPSLLRGFSAPVRLDAGQDDDQLALLFASDPDPFARYEAGQRLLLRRLLALVEDRSAGRPLALDPRIAEAARALLEDGALDAAFVAQALALPSASYLGQQMEVIDVEGIFEVRRFARARLADELGALWRATYDARAEDGPYAVTLEAVARRRLKNLCLHYLAGGGGDGLDLAWRQFETATNMTDRLAALVLLAESDHPARERALAGFYERFEKDALVVDKWFRVQATAEREDAVDTVRRLLAHPAFTPANPNRVRALVGAFAAGNPIGFHRKDGAGYRLFADQVLVIDRRNPQLAARLLTVLERWRRYDPARREMMKAELERILASEGLSRDCHEIASKSLA